MVCQQLGVWPFPTQASEMTEAQLLMYEEALQQSRGGKSVHPPKRKKMSREEAHEFYRAHGFDSGDK